MCDELRKRTTCTHAKKTSFYWKPMSANFMLMLFFCLFVVVVVVVIHMHGKKKKDGRRRRYVASNTAKSMQGIEPNHAQKKPIIQKQTNKQKKNA